MQRLLSGCAFAACAAASALIVPSANAQWTEATSTVPHNAGITFAPLGRAVRVSWKAWNATAVGFKYHLMRAGDATSAGADISGGLLGGLTFTDPSVAPGTTYFYWVVIELPPPAPGAKPGPQGGFVSGRVKYTSIMQAVQLPVADAPARGGRAIDAPQKAAAPPAPPAPPIISRLMSNVVPIGAPTFVVRGSRLGSVTGVKVGGAAQSWQKEVCAGFDGGDTSYVVTIAAPVAGPTTVELTSPAGVVSSPLTVEAAAITSVIPMLAKPGDWVTITGPQLADFQYSYTAGNCKTVKVTATGPTSVKFGTVAATAVRGVAGAGALTAQVPARSTGGISVVTAVHGTANSPTMFGETPVVTSMTPSTVSQGTTVTIAGTGLDGLVANLVQNAQSDQGTVLQAQPGSTYDTLRLRVPTSNPAGRTTVVYVKLTRHNVPRTPAVFGTVSNQLTWLMPVAVTAVTPNPVSVGVAVTITGTGIADPPAGAPAGWVPTVTFNGRPGTGVRIGNATTIYATVPVGATTGPIMVGTVAGPVVTITP